MKKLLLKHFEFELSQKKWGRRWIGGTWYRMRTALPMGDIWTRIPFKSCQARIMEIESHD